MKRPEPKKLYCKPQVKVIKLKHRANLLQSSGYENDGPKGYGGKFQ